MKKLFVLILFIVCTVSLKAQIGELFFTKADTIAWNHIDKLKSGVLLVRLNSNHHAINALKAQRRLDEAEYLKNKAEEINKSVIKAFNAGFTFCDVHFFLAESSEDVKWRDFNNVFVDDELQVIEGSPIKESVDFYVVEVGNVYFETFSEHFEGIAVMDEYFQQLKKPFPYFVRKYSGLRVIERTEVDMVLELDKKFNTFYTKSLGHLPAK